MHERPGDWLTSRAVLHPTGLYFSLRQIDPAQLRDGILRFVRPPLEELERIHAAR